MVERYRTQLFMMLVQQAGVGSLPLSNLQPEQFLEFIRKIENKVLSEGLSPVIVYWSTHNAKRLLPDGALYRQLMRDSFCISMFSDERYDKSDEICFFVESQGLTLVVHGRQNPDDPSGRTYQMVGSVDPYLVKQAFRELLPVWQFIDLAESNRLEDARHNVGAPNTSAALVQYCRTEWPVVKPASASEDTAPAERLSEPVGARPAPPAGRTTTGTDKPSAVNVVAPAPAKPTGGQPKPSQPPRTPAESGLAAPPPPVVRGHETSRWIKVLKEAWTPLSEEAPGHIFPLPAQQIIRDIVEQLRHSSDLPAILQLAIEQLTRVLHADRGLIWQVVGDQLTVTNEYSPSGHTCFAGANLGSQESTAVVLEFLSPFPDDSGGDVIAIPDTAQDTKLHKVSTTLSSLIELGEVRARLVAQLRCRGYSSGFLELQQCKNTRQWSDEDAAVLQAVAEVLSFVVQQTFDLNRIELDAKEKDLINTISALFRESRGQHSKDSLARSIRLVASHMGFLHSQIYLVNEEEGELQPQIEEAELKEPVSFTARNNPFLSVHDSGRTKVINAEFSRRGDAFFGHKAALIVPLQWEGERLGVLGLWERSSGIWPFWSQDRTLAVTIASSLASNVRADQAIVQIRSDRAREGLINRVSTQIRQSPKEVDEILDTLVQELREYFDLSLAVVSLLEADGKFGKSKMSGPLGQSEGPLSTEFAERLFEEGFDQLVHGQTPIVPGRDARALLEPKGLAVPEEIKLITLQPLMQGGALKGALCLVSCDRERPYSLKDMRMIEDLSDRVAIQVVHKELFETVERQAVTDPMTGLYNRRHFQEQLSKEIDRHHRFGHPFSYIMIDLDFLKRINDSLGHQYGDEAIKHIANVMKKAVRDVDTTARYGGEEFVVLLPETDVAGARIVADRMCAAIRENEVDGVGRVTASIGVATFPHDATDREKLVELADQALYLAKNRGRNQVCSVSDDLLPCLQERGEEALMVQKAAVKAKTEEMASIDLKLFAEHGLIGMLAVIVKVIESRDAYTGERAVRSTEIAARLARALHLPEDQGTVISLAASLHNIGKIAVSEEILQKKGKLNTEERKIIQSVPRLGARILEPAKHLYRVAAVIESCHEHWDGSGYPRGLKGEEIPLESRIISLVDAYVAMTSDRPYRKSLPVAEAVAELEKGSGSEWDPKLLRLFVALLNKERKDTGTFSI